MRAAEVSCAAEFIKKLPDKLDTHIGEKGLGLSEGQIQRLAVTRAILSDAPNARALKASCVLLDKN